MSYNSFESLSPVPSETNNEVLPIEFSTPIQGSSYFLKKIPQNRTQARQRNPFKEIEIVKILNQGKFPVYLAKANNRKYAMKLFPVHENGEKYYQNEKRFASLNHPNIIKAVHHEHNFAFGTTEVSCEASFILTEFAPHGDFLDFTDNFSVYFNDKLIRTYFHQLIEGLEYLHCQNVAHLDIKMENLLLGDGYILKIADFDISCSTKDSSFIGRGTKYFRAPELLGGECKDPIAADIYSAGVFLFAMKSGGFVPHMESKKFNGVDLQDLLWAKNEEFWSQHCRIQGKRPSYFSQDFRELVNGMLKEKPETRLTISQIKSSKWYSGPIYTPEELESTVKSLLSS